jgi:hypothetical protein
MLGKLQILATMKKITCLDNFFVHLVLESVWTHSALNVGTDPMVPAHTRRNILVNQVNLKRRQELIPQPETYPPSILILFPTLGACSQYMDGQPGDNGK